MGQNDEGLTAEQAAIIWKSSKILDGEAEAIDLLQKSGYFLEMDEESILGITSRLNNRIRKVENLVKEFKRENRKERENG